MILQSLEKHEHPTRALIQAPEIQVILKTLMQGPLRGFHQDLRTIFLYNIMQGPLRGSHQDLHKIFSQGPLQDLSQDLYIYEDQERTMKFSQDLHRRTLHRTHKISLPGSCASAAGNIKIRTARQERSDTDKVTRGLREHVLECQQIPSGKLT